MNSPCSCFTLSVTAIHLIETLQSEDLVLAESENASVELIMYP